MKGSFAAQGTGDSGATFLFEDGTVATKAKGFCGRDYCSVFGTFHVPRTVYRADARPGVMPLDAQADVPERCYSYLLQEWMDHLSLRESFQESEGMLTALFGLKVSASRVEVVNQSSVTHRAYEQLYAEKEPPSPDQEGDLQVLGWDGKGVPMITREAAKLKARPGKGEKRQKKKEALVGVRYTVAAHVRRAEEVAERLLSPENAFQAADQASGTTAPAPKAQQIRRLASLAQPKQEVVQEIVRDATARDPKHRRPWVVVMDGA